MAKSKTITEFNGGGASAKYSPLRLFRGFTLSEVLITLGIIGVIATIVIPTVVGKVNDHIRKTQSSGIQVRPSIHRCVPIEKGGKSPLEFFTSI